MSQKKQQQLTEPSKNLTTEERLFELLSSKADLLNMPMVSLPDNDNYWSEGWKSAESEMNTNNLSIVSSNSSPVSSSSASPLSSASSSPSSFFQTSSSSTSSNQQTNKLQSHSTETNLELTAEYLEAFNDKQHLIFYGHDSQKSPIILSYKIEPATDTNCCENLKAILRTKEKNYCMSIPVINLSGANTDNPDNVVITPSLVCKTLNPEIKIKFFYPLTDLNVSY